MGPVPFSISLRNHLKGTRSTIRIPIYPSPGRAVLGLTAAWAHETECERSNLIHAIRGNLGLTGASFFLFPSQLRTSYTTCPDRMQSKLQAKERRNSAGAGLEPARFRG